MCLTNHWQTMAPRFNLLVIVLQMKPSRSVHCDRYHKPSTTLVLTQVSAVSSLVSGSLLGQLVYSIAEPSTQARESAKTRERESIYLMKLDHRGSSDGYGRVIDSYCQSWSTSPTTRYSDGTLTTTAAPEQNDSRSRSQWSGHPRCWLESDKSTTKLITTVRFLNE